MYCIVSKTSVINIHILGAVGEIKAEFLMPEIISVCWIN